MTPRLDTQQLLCFLAVADHLSFRQAADRLDMSQPALSKQIRALEGQIGARLFERTTRRVRLTAAGGVFVEEARGVLRALESAQHRVREAERGVRGELIVGTSTPVAFSDLPRIVQAFERAHSSVRIRTKLMRSTELAVALTSRSIDVALGRPTSKSTEVKSIVVRRHPYVIVLPQSDPLALKKKIHLRSLADRSLVIYARSIIGEAYDRVIAFCQKHGYVPSTIEEVSGIEPMLGSIACGFGVALLPAPWQRAIGLPEVAFRPIAGPNELTFTIAASWNAGDKSPLVHAFASLAAALCAPL